MSEKVKTSEKGIHSRSRYFCIVTYASEKQLRKVIRNHISSVRAFCYILHDKDEATPHHHILLRTHSAWTPKQIARWFEGLIDAEKKNVNTFAEVAHDMEAQKDYIVHADPKSIEEGKHPYSMTDVKSYGFDDLAEKKNAHDVTYEILEKVINGAPLRDLVRYYGRDFLYHYSHYIEVADLIRQRDMWHPERTLQNHLNAFEHEEADLQEVEGVDDL